MIILDIQKNKDIIKLNPYAREIINWSRTNNLKLAIVTSKNLNNALALVEHFQLKIDLLMTPELSLKGSPIPSQF